VLRSLKRRSSAGIIVLTGRRDETDHVIGLELGADDYVTKPFRRRELVARINAVLRRVQPPEFGTDLAPAPARAVEHVFDGYRVNLETRRVHDPGGSEIELTTAEFNLLGALLGQRGQALSRAQLIEAIKGRDWEIHDRAIDGLVSRLRRKLPPWRGRVSPYIRTIHGIGYAFAD
jgi:two-component system, OmpR family, response regulator